MLLVPPKWVILCLAVLVWILCLSYPKAPEKVHITAFASASLVRSKETETYFTDVETIGGSLSTSKFELIWGGGTTGLMGKVSLEFQEAGGTTEGHTIPLFLHEIDNHYAPTNKPTVIYKTLVERQQALVDLGQVYLVLPGGIGTTKEMLDVIMLVYEGVVPRHIYIMNSMNHYDVFFEYLEDLKARGVIRGKGQLLLDKYLHVYTDATRLADALNSRVF
jgi:uncharacterized protein (TIGR00730 family)